MSLPNGVSTLLQGLRSGQNLLVVEGDDDKEVYEKWLLKLKAEEGLNTAAIQVAKAPNEGKEGVLNVLKHTASHPASPRVFGLVDRDEWTDEDCAARAVTHPHLLVNPARHCLENYFCDPDWLQAALDNSPLRDNGFAKSIQKLRGRVAEDLKKWTEHWALWVTTQRVQAEERDAKFPNAFHDGLTLPSTEEIKQTIQRWSNIVDCDRLMGSFRAQVKQAKKINTAAGQLSRAVHGKNVFRIVVCPDLRTIKNHGVGKDDWLVSLAEWTPVVPTDAAEMLRKVVPV